MEKVVKNPYYVYFVLNIIFATVTYAKELENQVTADPQPSPDRYLFSEEIAESRHHRPQKPKQVRFAQTVTSRAVIPLSPKEEYQRPSAKENKEGAAAAQEEVVEEVYNSHYLDSKEETSTINHLAQNPPAVEREQYIRTLHTIIKKHASLFNKMLVHFETSSRKNLDAEESNPKEEILYKNIISSLRILEEYFKKTKEMDKFSQADLERLYYNTWLITAFYSYDVSDFSQTSTIFDYLQNDGVTKNQTLESLRAILYKEELTQEDITFIQKLKPKSMSFNFLKESQDPRFNPRTFFADSNLTPQEKKESQAAHTMFIELNKQESIFKRVIPESFETLKSSWESLATQARLEKVQKFFTHSLSSIRQAINEKINISDIQKALDLRDMQSLENHYQSFIELSDNTFYKIYDLILKNRSILKEETSNPFVQTSLAFTPIKMAIKTAYKFAQKGEWENAQKAITPFAKIQTIFN